MTIHHSPPHALTIFTTSPAAAARYHHLQGITAHHLRHEHPLPVSIYHPIASLRQDETINGPNIANDDLESSSEVATISLLISRHASILPCKHATRRSQHGH